MAVMLQIFFFGLLFSGVTCLGWTEDSSEDQIFYICVGKSVTFPWNYDYASQPGHKSINLMWMFYPSSNQRQILGSFTYGEFFNPFPTYAERLTMVGENSAGIILKNVTKEDSGTYQVMVRIHINRTFFSAAERNATLMVIDRLPVENDQVDIVQYIAMIKDDVSDEWTFPLGCGKFTYIMRPPFEVKWKVPGGEIIHKSNLYANGRFILLLKNLVMNGTYECYVPEAAREANCIAPEDIPTSMASVDIDGIQSQIEILVAETRELKKNLKGVEEDTNKHFADLAIPIVSFNVMLMEDEEPNNYTMVTFDKELHNEGGAFDIKKGYFMAPYTGEYFFGLAIKNTAGVSSARIMVNCAMNMTRLMICNAVSAAMANCEATVFLNKGDIVYASSPTPNPISNSVSNFVGFLINDVGTHPEMGSQGNMAMTYTDMTTDMATDTNMTVG